MRTLVRPLPICLCACLLLLSACLPSMELETPEGAFRLIGRRISGRRTSGRRTSGQAGAQLTYRLAEPLPIDDTRQAFFLRYTEATADATLRLLLANAPPDTQPPAIGLHPSTGIATELHIPLPPSTHLVGFEITADQRIVPPLSAGVGLLFNGYAIESTNTQSGASNGASKGTALANGSDSGDNVAVVVRAGIDRRSTDDGGYLYRFGAATEQSDPQRLFVRIEYEWPFDSGSGHIEVGNGDQQRSFTLNLRPRRTSIYLYSAWLGFVPTWLRIGPPDKAGATHTGTAETRIDVHALEIGELEIDTPIAADMGVILTQRADQLWRRTDWELFAWNLFPSILVLDSRSYAIQARFFKRLAFFAEKRGYRGRVLGQQELAGLSGWRAHNYDAERLASFFGEAARQGIELTDEEQLLLRLLLANDIIARRAGSADDYVPLQGGILAISQESPPPLRQFLLTHESFHGLYASSAEYRSEALRIWRGQTDEERAFWGRLFGSLSYDPDHAPLVLDEFQAYLMHYDQQQAEGYWQVMLARLNQRLPQQRTATLRLIEANPQLFTRSAAALDNAARRHSGLRAGDVRCLIRMDLPDA